MLTEKDQLVSADEEKIKTVGRMTNVAFRLGKVHALGDVVVLDISTYDVLFGLPALVALRANLDFERRSTILRNTGGKPYAVPMRLTLRTTINAVPRVSPMIAGTLRIITWEDSADDEPSSKDVESSDENDPQILKLARRHIYYPPPRTIARTMHLTSRNIQRTKAMILGEPLVQISRMVDSLEPPQTLYEGISPLLARYNDKKHYCDITDVPKSLLTPAKEVRLLRLGSKASPLEPPGHLEVESNELVIKIATRTVPWQDICDGITPEGHVAIREEDAQIMVTVFSWRFAPPPDVAKQARTKQIDVRIRDQLLELHVPQYVPDEIHRLIADILMEYQGAISVTDTDIGLSFVIQHEIQTGNHSPIHCKPYRYSLIERKKVLERIREFEASGWIEPTTGPWSFPVVLVPKKNGSIRICIDYRKLNEITIKDVYPLPRIDDLLDAIGCANYFSKFDIRHGFHHILVKEEDRPKTDFVLFEGTWQWVRFPIGICNAPATFQRAMNVTFQNFVNKTRLTQGMINFCLIVYMDDILVYSETYHGHAQYIRWTLGALRDAGFKIALEKSEFFLSEISFLGYVVTRGGLRPDSRKLAVVKEAPVPTSLTQVRAFLGLASYYRHFIKGFAAIARPLTNLLRKDQPLQWDYECGRAFDALKEALVTTPILIRPDPTKQFILITVWQPEAISAILAQKGNDGREHVIEYTSQTVPDERRNDSTPQGECYAVVWGIQQFHPYLYGQKFRLVMDHAPLLALKKLTNYTGMIGRWAVRLQEYDFDIIHRKTERHGNADGLTRLHRPAKWSACLEKPGNDRNPPSQWDYLSPREIIDPAYFRDRTATEDEVIAAEEEAAEEEEEGEDDEEKTPEEGSYSEHSEGEQSEEEEEEEEQSPEEEEEEEDQEELEELEWEGFEEEVRAEARAHAQAQKKEEIATEKRQLEFASAAGPPTIDDPEPPKPEHGDPAAETSAAAARRRRSRSPFPSTTDRPLATSAAARQQATSALVSRDVRATLAGHVSDTSADVHDMSADHISSDMSADNINDASADVRAMDNESEADYETRLADMMLELKQRADAALSAREKQEREATLQQQANEDAARQAADEARQTRRDALFEEEAEVLTLATEWDTLANLKEEGAFETVQKFSKVIKRIVDLVATSMAQQEDILTLDNNVQKLTTRVHTLEQRPVAGTAVGPSNIPDRVNTLEIDVGTLKDGAQQQHATNQQLEQEIRAEAASLASSSSKRLPKFDGIPVFCDTSKTDSIPWWRQFALRLRMSNVSSTKRHACLYHRSGGAWQAWLDNMLSTHKVDISELHAKISWTDLTTA
ncbi:hypothetical protein CBR_g6370 [Chara braunii]|uniref:RNA-directed DNA polymerase n=1 Tax=Chara braunii TaxID=69332 RepID=A0A388KJL1_CHABU|nr:hypothetical protein CBR_g6370 [Chara braunii]|eukprot:GBG70242.1 hypothetical protein CBR_g6370 [Chara braunii]